jgi:hypothetical protein
VTLNEEVKRERKNRIKIRRNINLKKFKMFFQLHNFCFSLSKNFPSKMQKIAIDNN